MIKKTQQKTCENCDFSCVRALEWDRHILTQKHKNRTNSTEKASLQKEFKCKICEKIYMARNSLWYHEKNCAEKKNNKITAITNTNDMICELIKQNDELQKQLCEFMKDGKNIVNNNNMIHNSINNNFNLNIFLNEKCKDALNISDFVDSLKLTLTDLENVGSQGFVEGISRIFVKGLKQLDVCKRPIHCSDLKRETMYIKNSDAWEKENEEKQNMRKAIKQIADKNINVISEWKCANPDCKDSESKKNDQYMQIISESIGEEDDDNYKKIIRSVAKNVVIEK